jgi:hypothetical protein
MYKLEQSARFSKSIITGKFVEGRDPWELSTINKGAPMLYYTGTFLVRRVLKGVTMKRGDTLQVTSDFSNCSFLYKSKSDYILFTEGKEVRSSICSFTRTLNDEEGRKVYKQTKRLKRKRLLTTGSS